MSTAATGSALSPNTYYSFNEADGTFTPRDKKSDVRTWYAFFTMTPVSVQEARKIANYINGLKTEEAKTAFVNNHKTELTKIFPIAAKKIEKSMLFYWPTERKILRISQDILAQNSKTPTNISVDSHSTSRGLASRGPELPSVDDDPGTYYTKLIAILDHANLSEDEYKSLLMHIMSSPTLNPFDKKQLILRTITSRKEALPHSYNQKKTEDENLSTAYLYCLANDRRLLSKITYDAIKSLITRLKEPFQPKLIESLGRLGYNPQLSLPQHILAQNLTAQGQALEDSHSLTLKDYLKNLESIDSALGYEHLKVLCKQTKALLHQKTELFRT